MKKCKIGMIILTVCVLCNGCFALVHPEAEDDGCRAVTGIRITFDNGPFHVEREYATTEKMKLILNYLRGIDPFGTPDEDPETAAGSNFRIVLSYSDGCEKSYLQKSDRFLQVEGQKWERIDPQKARELSSILGRTESDL